jgi:glycosyltransferase involved in cell wall biosynthesis
LGIEQGQKPPYRFGDECMPGKKIKLQFFSRDVPVLNYFGSGSIVMSFLSYLNKKSFEIEYVLLDPVFAKPVPILRFPAFFKLKCMDVRTVGRYLIDFRVKRLLNYIYFSLLDKSSVNIKNILKRSRSFYYQLDKKPRVKNIPVSLKIMDSYLDQKELDFARSTFIDYKPDVVIANYAWVAGVFDVFPLNHYMKVVLTHDVLYKRFQSYREKGLSNNQTIKTREDEIKALSKADILLAVQSDDEIVFKEMLPDKEIINISYSKEINVVKGKEVDGRVLYVGSGADHNVTGLEWFLEETWPLIIKKYPSAHLHVAGTICLQMTHNYPNVRYLGQVENLDKEYQAAKVCIVPLIVGSGLKIKLIDYLASGKACVTTRVGTQGVRDMEENAVLVADSPEEFAESVVNLLTNDDMRVDLEHEAINFVQEHFSPQTTYQRFVDYVMLHFQTS